jgi:K+-transporting ATPase ATPase B chain
LATDHPQFDTKSTTLTVLRAPRAKRGFVFLAAIREAFAMLSPRAQLRDATTLGLCLASVAATLIGFAAMPMATVGAQHPAFMLAVAGWLWLGVLLAGLLQALAEQSLRLSAAQQLTGHRQPSAKRLVNRDRKDFHLVEAAALRRGDLVLVESGDIIPADGTIIDGAASVSESSVTGESAPVLRSTDRESSCVYRGTLVLSDWLVLRVRSREGFYDPVIKMSNNTRRPLSLPEFIPPTVLTVAAVAFLIATAMPPRLQWVPARMGGTLMGSALVALLVCLVPLMTRAITLVSGVTSVKHLLAHRIVATSATAVEAAADVDILAVDKTGTMTLGDRRIVSLRPAPEVSLSELVDVAELTSLADDTPEGRSIVAFVAKMPNRRARDPADPAQKAFAFSARTRLSGIVLGNRQLCKGAPDAVRRFVEAAGGRWSSAISDLVDEIARSGATPLAVADGPRALGVVELQDVIKDGIREHNVALRNLGIRTFMLTGDHPLTARAIMAEVGVDNFLAEATPERKRELIRRWQEEGYRVAMYGDGANDAPALAQANVAVAMNSGTQAAKEAVTLVDLDSSPNNFLAIVAAGRDMLQRREALTILGLSIDLAKYLAILPVLLAANFPAYGALNLLRLPSRHGAVASALLMSILLPVPLLLMATRAISARTPTAPRLTRPLWWMFGLAGFIATYTAVKLVDLTLAVFGYS